MDALWQDIRFGWRQLLKHPGFTALAILSMFIVHWSLRDTSIESAVNRMPVWAVTGIWTFMAGAILLTQGNSNAFIYFQF